MAVTEASGNVTTPAGVPTAHGDVRRGASSKPGTASVARDRKSLAESSGTREITLRFHGHRLQPEAIVVVFCHDQHNALTGAVSLVTLIQADPAATMAELAESAPGTRSTPTPRSTRSPSPWPTTTSSSCPSSTMTTSSQRERGTSLEGSLAILSVCASDLLCASLWRPCSS